MMVCDGDGVRGYISVADTLRPESVQAVADLRATGAQTVLLTGDNAAAAAHVAEQVGVDSVRSNLLPEDKLQAVQALGEQHGPTAMVGDGINDTPALAAAALGVAMGGSLQASAQAMETADVVLMGGDLSALPYAVKLSAFARRLIRQNVAISLGTKLLFMGLAMAGLTSLWLAVLADVGVSLVVTTNGLRANRYQ
jgi:Cd2+/Zn2+-exporting ATPase